MALFVYFTHIYLSFRYAYREIYIPCPGIQNTKKLKIPSDRQFVFGWHSLFSLSLLTHILNNFFLRSFPQLVHADFNNICMPPVFVVVFIIIAAAAVVVVFNFANSCLNRFKPVGCMFLFFALRILFCHFIKILYSIR